MQKVYNRNEKKVKRLRISLDDIVNTYNKDCTIVTAKQVKKGWLPEDAAFVRFEITDECRPEDVDIIVYSKEFDEVKDGEDIPYNIVYQLSGHVYRLPRYSFSFRKGLHKTVVTEYVCKRLDEQFIDNSCLLDRIKDYWMSLNHVKGDHIQTTEEKERIMAKVEATRLRDEKSNEPSCYSCRGRIQTPERTAEILADIKATELSGEVDD